MKERRSFAELQAEYRRAILLRFLSEDADYAMDTGLLKTALKSVGHGVPLRQVNEDAAWLEERGLVACESLEFREEFVGLLSRHKPVLFVEIILSRQRLHQAETRIDGRMVQSLVAAEVSFAQIHGRHREASPYRDEQEGGGK